MIRLLLNHLAFNLFPNPSFMCIPIVALSAHWLIDCLVFDAVSALFQSYNGGYYAPSPLFCPMIQCPRNQLESLSTSRYEATNITLSKFWIVPLPIVNNLKYSHRNVARMWRNLWRMLGFLMNNTFSLFKKLRKLNPNELCFSYCNNQNTKQK